MTQHLHILGTEIQKKYFWLKQAHFSFTGGLLISTLLVVYGLNIPTSNQTANFATYKFEKIYEPSGAVNVGGDSILIAEDENSQKMRIVTFDQNNQVIDNSKVDFADNSKEFFKVGIADVEALTSDRDTIYGITSFSIDKKGILSPQREKLFSFTYKNKYVNNLEVYANLKQDLMIQYPNIFDRETLNIEALSYSPLNNNLYIGFRSPLHSENAIVLSISNIDEVLSSKAKPIFTDLHFLNLDGEGLRDMTYDPLGKIFWLVSGSVNERKNSFSLWKWDGINNPKKMAAIMAKMDPLKASNITALLQLGPPFKKEQSPQLSQ
jgi:hypothetical protein